MNLFELFVKIGADTSQAEKGMKNTQKNSETLTNKIKVMSAQFESAQKNVDKLTQEFNESVKKTGATSKETQELAKKLDDAEKEAEQAKKALDGYNSELGETETKTEKAGVGLSNFASKLGKGLATAAKIGTAAVATAAAGITALTTAAVNSFSEYEQLAGGASKIFDQMSQTEILRDAQNAYKELGLSANEYLAVINDVGATFAATMGDEAGYRTAQQGLKAISDYASGTGKNVDELSQKFTLITRSTSSYQSIADQFSGILPATSKDFLKQAQAAGLLSKKYNELTKVPIAEYQAAVSAMLEKGVEDLGLANNTAMEAATTICGSLAAFRGSWSNLITGLADDNADFSLLMDNFVESTVNAANNILPRVGTTLGGIVKLVKELVPVAMEYIPQIIGQFLPDIAKAAVGIVTSIGGSITKNLGKIVGWVQDMLDSLIDGIMKTSSSDISSTVTKIITSLGNFVISNLPKVLSSGIEILLALANGIIDAIPELAGAATQAIVDFASYLISGDNISNIIKTARNLIENLGNGIKEAARGLFGDVGANVVQSIIDGISSAWSGLVSWFNGMWDSLFGNLTADVNVNGNGGGGGKPNLPSLDGSHALGLDYVPFDGYIAELHKGERVLTAKEAKSYGSQNTYGDIIIQVSGAEYHDEDSLAEAIAEKLQMMTDRRMAVYA